MKFLGKLTFKFKNTFKIINTKKTMKKDKQNTPKVSILMPVYNGEKFLDETIKSIINQTFKDFEFIIVNDSSTDNSLKIIKSYKDKRIRLIINKKNVGFENSLNVGLKAAKGKYIASCNQDDVSHPKRIEIEFNYLENHPEIFLIGTSAVFIDENGKEIRRFRKYNDYKMLAWRLRKSCGIVYPSTMYRNEGVSFDKYLEYHLYYKLLKKGKKITNIPHFLIKFRVHSKAMSVYDKKQQEYLRDQVIKKFKDLNDPTNIFDKIYYSMKMLIHYIRTIKEKKII